MRGSTSVPVANTWYVDEAGNFVLMSEAQRQAVELAQLPTPDVPLQSLTETASSSMQIPPDMLQQVMGWSAAMGGVAGGGLVGSLALSSGMLIAQELAFAEADGDQVSPAPQPVLSDSGTMVETANSNALWSGGRGSVLDLSYQRYELAQEIPTSIDDSPETA